MRAIAWNIADRIDELMFANDDCCLAFTPMLNEWNGQQRSEMCVVDLAPGATVQLG